MEKKFKKANKKSFEKHLYDYLNGLSEEEQRTVAMGLWQIWNASREYNENHYGQTKRHSDISDLAIIAYNVARRK